MYVNELLNKYKYINNYIQDKQICHDLNIDSSKLSRIRKGNLYLTETEAIFLAENSKTDPAEALIRLAADRAKTCKGQQLWKDIVAKMSSRGWNVASLGMTGFFAAKLSAIECVLCLCYGKSVVTDKYISIPYDNMFYSSAFLTNSCNATDEKQKYHSKLYFPQI